MPTAGPEISIPKSPEFERLTERAGFRDRIAIPAREPADVLFRAACEVTLREMPVARLMGAVRYLPSRLLGHAPPDDLDTPFLSLLMDGGTLLLYDDAPREVITGSAGQLHRIVDQAAVRFRSRKAFDAFADPRYEKLFMSLRVVPAEKPGEQWLVLEHATEALSPQAERKFRRYWHVIKPAGAFVTLHLLKAIERRASAAFRDTKHAA